MIDKTVIKKATLKDVDSLLGLENKTFNFMLWSKLDFINAVNNKEYLVLTLKIKNELIGFMVARLGKDECEIENVAIKENHRQKGCADRLVRAIIERATKLKCKNVFLEVATNNLPAIKLYEKHGFKKSYTRKKYYGDIDAFVYALECI